jgi:hypothetical protein
LWGFLSDGVQTGVEMGFRLKRLDEPLHLHEGLRLLERPGGKGVVLGNVEG